MGERLQAKLRELKEAAHALFIRGRYAQCAELYARILRLSPKDSNARMRQAEALRRAGDRQAAIAAYQAAAELMVELGCESRARGALRAALELDPKDPMLLAGLARLGSSTTAQADGPTGAGASPGTPPVLRPRPASAPPPPPPPHILKAAEETSASRPLPPVPSIAPVSLEALRARGGASPAQAPRQPAVRALPATPPAEASVTSLTMLPLMPYKPELRRLGPNVVALRVSPQARWVIIRSDSALQVSRAETLPEPEPLVVSPAGRVAESHAAARS